MQQGSTAPTCEECKGREFVYRFTDDGEMVARPCKCYKRMESLRRLRRSGLERSIRDLTFDSYRATEQWQCNALASAKAYAKELQGWFYIGGQVGGGKTHLCTAICREALLSGVEVRYISWRDEVQSLKRIGNVTDYDDAICPLKTVDLLYIDDLFKGGESDGRGGIRPTAADINIAFDILDYRYKNKLPTVISGERYIDELMQIDQGVASRIYQMSKGHETQITREKERNYRMREETP